MLIPALTYDNEALLWKAKEISRIRLVQMVSFKCLLGIRRMDIVPNARIRELCGVTGIDKRIDGSAMLRGWRGIGLLRGSM